MLSFLGRRAITPDPAQVVESSHSQANEPKSEAALVKLAQENLQLRQELKDAHYRILELERSLAVFVANDEVQSIADLSVTSSVTTIPTGSPLANKKREKQRKRDAKIDMLKGIQKTYYNRNNGSSARLRNNFSWTPAPSVRSGSSTYQTYICESDSSFESAMCSSLSEGEVSDYSSVMGVGRGVDGQHKFPAYTDRYFLRQDDSLDEVSVSSSIRGGIESRSMFEI